MRFRQIREEVLKFSQKMLRDGLVTLTSGNISARDESGYVAITPSGVPYDSMTLKDIVIVDVHGTVIDGRLKPSSEMPMHLLILRERPDVNAVVHTHSPYALSFAVVKRQIPIVCMEGLAVRGSIPVADYAPPGSEDHGWAALKALEAGGLGVLLQNHGVLTIGKTLAQAYAVARKVEIAAQVYYLALQIGEPLVMTEEQITAIFEKYIKGQGESLDPL